MKSQSPESTRISLTVKKKISCWDHRTRQHESRFHACAREANGEWCVKILEEDWGQIQEGVYPKECVLYLKGSCSHLYFREVSGLTQEVREWLRSWKVLTIV